MKYRIKSDRSLKKFLFKAASIISLSLISIFYFHTIYAYNSNNKNFTKTASITEKNDILILSDIHLNKTTSHIMDISPTKFDKENDLDENTFISMLENISNQIKDGKLASPKCILLLGDLVAHDQTPEKSLANQTEVFTQLKKYFNNIPMFYVFGNNDSLVRNYGPFLGSVKTNLNSLENLSPYKVAIASGWKDGFLSSGNLCGRNNTGFPCISTENTKSGYYSAYIDNQLKLIGFNSVMLSPKRSDISTDDVKTQMLWLEQELQYAQKNNEKVIIAMHIPPGRNIYDDSQFWISDEENEFLSLISKYKNNIIGLLASHTHTEELKILKTKIKNAEPINEVIFAPGLSTSHGNMPAYKTLMFEKESENSWILKDFDCYHLFLDDNKKLNSEKLYNFQNYYCSEKACSDIFDGLKNVTIEKIKSYYTTGNKNYTSQIKFENDLIIEVN